MTKYSPSVQVIQQYRQAGSSFKPYVYLTALENGWRPSSIESDGPVSCGNWSPQNYGHAGYRGNMTLENPFFARGGAASAACQHSTVSTESAGRNTKRLGIARSVA